MAKNNRRQTREPIGEVALVRANKAATSVSPVNVFVFRPGATGPLASNVFATQAPLDAAVLASNGPTDVQYDPTFANTPLNGTMWRPAGIRDVTLSGLLTGTSLSILGPIGGLANIKNLSILYAQGAPGLFTMAVNESSVFDFDNVQFPLPYHGGAVTLIDASAANASAYINARNGSSLGAGTPFGVYSLLIVGGSSFAQINIEDVSSIRQDSVFSDASLVTLTVAPGASFGGFQNHITGGPPQIIFGIASQIAYTDTNGSYAGSPPTTVQEAIDRMAALVVTLNGGTKIP